MSDRFLNKVSYCRPIGRRKRKAILNAIHAFRATGWWSMADICRQLGVERSYLAAVLLYRAPPTREIALKLDLLATCQTLPGMTPRSISE
jgi:hypothetical protein